MATQFLKELMEIADPLDMDLPQDKDLADGGKRMENIDAASAACNELVKVTVGDC